MGRKLSEISLTLESKQQSFKRALKSEFDVTGNKTCVK